MTQGTNGAAIAPTTSKVDVLKKVMAAPRIKEQFDNVLKDNSAVFVASIIDLYASDNYLQNCDPNLVVMEALKAAVLKLPVNKSLGFAYIVPFNENKQVNGQWVKHQVPQMQIGYKGLIQLAMRTGQYRFINADAVHQGEFVRSNKLTGEFDLTGTRTGDEVQGYFAYIEMLNGFSKILYMSKEQVTAHAKKYSKAFATTSGPWQKEFDAMAKKTVLRNLLSHYGFLSVEMVGTVNGEEEDQEEVVGLHIAQHANRQAMTFDEADVLSTTTNGNGNPPPPAAEDDTCPI